MNCARRSFFHFACSQAPTHIVIYKYEKESSFRQGLPESSHMDVKAEVDYALRISAKDTGRLPSMALDTGIPVRYDGPLASREHLCIKVRTPDWEPAEN